MMKVTAMTCLCVDVFDGTEEIRPGGEALNFAAAAAGRYEHIQMSLIGGIGDDDYGKSILDSISGLKINTDCVHVIPGGTTASNRTYLTKDGDRYYLEDSWQEGVYGSFTLSDMDKQKMKESKLIHTNFSCPIFFEIIKLKKEYGFLLSVDFDKERNFSGLEEILPYIDYFFISGEKCLLPVLKKWSIDYKGVFTATLAEKGSIAYENGIEYRVDAVKVPEVIDTTGCGDSYQAGFICSVIQAGQIKAAMEEGSRLAAETLSHIGGF